MPPKVFFCHRSFVQLNSKFKISCTNSKLLLKGFWQIWPQWPWPLIGFLCHPGWMCGPSLRRVGQGILELLNGNGFGTFDPGDLDHWPGDPIINRVSQLPQTDVWTEFEEGTSRRSSVIDQKQKVTDGQIDRPTCAKQYMPAFFRRGT